MNTLSSTDGETRTLKRIALESKPSMFTNFITSALATPTPQAAPSTPIGEAWGGCERSKDHYKVKQLLVRG